MIAELWEDAAASASDKPTDARALLAAVAGAALVGAVWSIRGAVDAGWCLFALGATWCLARWIAQFAHALGATVLPGGRAIHNRPTPLLGGLAILIPLSIALFAQGDVKLVGFSLGCLLMAGVGAVDDLRTLPPRVKIVAQVFAALILFQSGFTLPVLSFPPFGAIATGPWELPLLIGWVVLVTNAVNLIDGMDGLASSLGLLGALACAALGYGGVAPFVLAATLIGFLRHNLAPARIFLGDTGSLMLGFALAALLLDGSAGMNVPVAVGILALPLGDVFLAALRRWLRGKPIFTADRGHVHHLLLNTWGHRTAALAALVGFAGIHAAVAVGLQNSTGLGLSVLIWLLFGAYLLRIARSRWAPMLEHRRRFKRAHVVRNYASAAIALSESRAEVRSVLERVAEDFNLTFLRLDEIVVRRALDPEGFHEEIVDCKTSVGSWRRAPETEPLVYAEERRAIVCDLLRAAAQRLKGLAAEEESRAGGFAVPRAQVHFVLSPGDDLERVQPLMEETRRSTRIALRVVNTGHRAQSSLFDAIQPAGFEPDIHLDAEEDGDAADLCQRYRALIEDDEPALVVVVGRSTSVLGIAAVAKSRGIPVARVDVERRRIEGLVGTEFNEVMVTAIADLHVTTDSRVADRLGIVSAFEGLAAARRES